MPHFIQGPNDGLCGFYVVLNGLSFVWSGWARKDDQTRFDEAVLALACVRGVSIRNIRGGPPNGGIRGDKLEGLLKVLSKRWKLKLRIAYFESERSLGVRSLFEAAESSGRRIGMIAAIEGGKHWVAVVRRGGNLVAIDCRWGRDHPKFIRSPRFYDKEAIIFELFSEATD